MKNKSTHSCLTFTLDERTVGIDVKRVINVLDMKRITPIAKAPHYVKGMIRHQEKPLPVLDARLIFGLPEGIYTFNTCILVVKLTFNQEGFYIGLIVDRINSVEEIRKDQVEIPVKADYGFQPNLIFGVAQKENRTIILPHLNQSLDFNALQKTIKSRNKVKAAT
jgi:purine-binding chemotaxis protein CheW